jgi:hypothetical protein
MNQEESGAGRDSLMLSGTISQRDLVNHNRYHFQRFNRILLGISFVLFMGIFLTFILGVEEDMGVKGFLLLFSLIISVIISYLLFLWARLVNRIRAAKEYKSDQLLQNEIFLSVSSEEIQQKVRRSVNHFQWSDILAAHEHKDMFRLYISKNKAILIPMTFFTSKEELEQLKSLIRKNVSPDKIKFR